MNRFLNKGKVVLLSVLALSASCGDMDLFDTDKWSDKIEGWEPGVKVAVAKGSFTLWDLIHQSGDSVIVREGDNLVIQYLEKDIYKLKVEDIFDMPKQSIQLKQEYDLADLGIPVDLNLPVPEPGIELPELEIKEEVGNIPNDCKVRKLSASAELTLPALGFEYSINAEFRNITTNGEAFTINESLVPAAGMKVSLENMVLTFEDEIPMVDFTINRLFIPGGTNLNSTILDLNFGLNDLTFIKVEGELHVDPIAIDPGKFDLDVDFLNEIGGDFKFTKPELNIVLRNKGIGVPLSVDAVFRGGNADRTLEMKLNDGQRLTTDGNSLNVMRSDTLGFRSTNSNIVDFLSLPPTGEITYGGEVLINPDNLNTNVLFNDAEVALDAYIRIPFELSGSLSYKDTLADIDIDQKYADKIKEGVIEVVAKNGLPLSLAIPGLVMLDENGNRLETLKATVGKDKLQASGEGRIEFKINHEQAMKLGKTDRILLEVKTETLGSGGVAIKATDKLEFSLVITAAAMIDNLNEF